MKTKIVFLLLFFLISASIWGQTMFTPDSDKVESLQSAALHSGELLPFNTFPASLVDLQNAYDTLFPNGTPDIPSTKQWVHDGIYGRYGMDINVDGTLTNNLNSFWNETYPKIKSELSRRYPKHRWE